MVNPTPPAHDPEAIRARVLTWLDDAYAMEQAHAEVLERRAEDAAHDEFVRGRILQHLDETRGQAEIVRSCMRELGGAPSSGKRTFAEMFGAAQGLANRPFDDVLVKDAIADYAFEHYEIAAYRALIEALQDLDRVDLADRFEGVLRQEEDMAAFLERQLPVAVRSRLSGDETAEPG